MLFRSGGAFLFGIKAPAADWLGGSRCGSMTWRLMIGQNTSPPTPSALLSPYPLTLSHTSTTRTISSPLSFSSHAPARPRRRRSFPPPPSPQRRRPTSSHLPRAPETETVNPNDKPKPNRNFDPTKTVKDLKKKVYIMDLKLIFFKKS